MELMQLYNQIENPLDSNNVLERLVEIYSKETSFYSGLTKTVEKEYKEGNYFISDSDEFYSMLFNKWKNSIIAITKEEFDELKRKGSYDDDFIVMRNFLKSIPDLKTKQEVNNVINGKYNNPELEQALDKYKWNSFGEYSGWIHVCSRYLTAKKDIRPNEEHRLYLNTESVDTYQLMNLIVKKYEKYKIPYYFKFDQYGNRDDTIVIYCSTENLIKNIEILQEIKNENQELISRTKQPPILTGKIDGWIGYGSEPEMTPSGEKQSFNQVREKAIEPAIAKTFMNWINSNINKKIKYKEKEMSFKYYMVERFVEKLIDKCEHDYNIKKEAELNKASRLGKTFNENDVIMKVGYSLRDIKTEIFKNNVFNILIKYIDNILLALNNDDLKNLKEIEMTVRNGQKITFSKYDVDFVIRRISSNILKAEPEILTEVRNNIEENSKHFGIDLNKFCFDERIVKKFKTIDSQNNKDFINDENNNKKYNMDGINVQTITDIINPELMKKRLKLPNGVELSARQYIQEVVYPYLPSNGVVVLNNGAPLSIKQFIEECVMFECQEKYNGDFDRYFAERTMSQEDNVNTNSRKR